MDIVVKAALVYLGLLIVLRIAGRRMLDQLNSFDLVIILIISEAVQQTLIGDETSFTAAMLAVITLVVLDVGISLFQQKFPASRKWIQGTASLLVVHGVPQREIMRRARVSEDDILESARRRQGLGRLDEIEFAVLETSGVISIIPKRESEK